MKISIDEATLTRGSTTVLSLASKEIEEKHILILLSPAAVADKRNKLTNCQRLKTSLDENGIYVLFQLSFLSCIR